MESKINYELALELKKAGFPQPDRYGNLLENCTCGSVEYLGGNKVHPPNSDCLVMEPNLSELIDACGEKFGKLISPTYRQRYDGVRDYWVAMSDDDRHDGYDMEGTTPEEAVARLWLALNKYD
jgi:hypothetical protein